MTTDPAGGDVEVGVGGDDDRALAAEFEGHRVVVGTSRTLILRPISVPPIEQCVVESAARSSSDLGVAFDDAHGVAIEVAGEIGDQRRRRRRELQMADPAQFRRPPPAGQFGWSTVVPRTDDQPDAEWFVLDQHRAGCCASGINMLALIQRAHVPAA